ncbi:hypothetical protein MASR1M8_20580 [Thermomonas brevis]
MVRTHSAALAHSAGFAMLHPASRPQLDATRIATLSGTLAVNLLAIGLLMLPLSLPPPAPLAERKPDMEWVWIPRTPVTPPPPVPVDIVRTPPRSTSTAPTTRAPTSTAPARQPAAVPVPDGAVIDIPGETAEVDAGGGSAGPSIPTTPAPVQLQYASAPAPAYPRSALRAGFEGTVLLQVLVDVDGRPLEVTVFRGSGHRELDGAAREQVLRRWRFHPAMIDGRAVQAVGLVPVAFSLR